MVRLYYYPACSTCKKAIKYLKDKNVEYQLIHIVDDTPSKDRLRELVDLGQVPVKKLFNTSGKVYREKELKDKLPAMKEDEILALLAKEGMLIKRPLLVGEDFALVGFKEEEWERKIRG